MSEGAGPPEGGGAVPVRRIVVAANASGVFSARAFIEDVCRTSLPANALFRLCVAVDELLTNAVTHGQSGAEFGAPLELTLATSLDCVAVEISDPGPPFNLLEYAQAPVLDGPIEDRPIGGLGIHLIKNLITNVTYRRNGGRNVTRLVVPRSQDGVDDPH